MKIKQNSSSWLRIRSFGDNVVLRASGSTGSESRRYYIAHSCRKIYVLNNPFAQDKNVNAETMPAKVATTARSRKNLHSQPKYSNTLCVPVVHGNGQGFA